MRVCVVSEEKIRIPLVTSVGRGSLCCYFSLSFSLFSFSILSEIGKKRKDDDDERGIAITNSRRNACFEWSWNDVLCVCVCVLLVAAQRVLSYCFGALVTNLAQCRARCHSTFWNANRYTNKKEGTEWESVGRGKKKERKKEVQVL